MITLGRGHIRIQDLSNFCVGVCQFDFLLCFFVKEVQHGSERFLDNRFSFAIKFSKLYIIRMENMSAVYNI